MTKEQGEKKLKDAGYSQNIIYWHDVANTVNAEHTHPEDIGIIVLSGTIDVVTYSIKDSYREGDFYEIKSNMPHHSTVGKEGCEYMVGKKKDLNLK